MGSQLLVSLTQELEEAACAYALSALSNEERARLELEMETNPALRQFTTEMLEIVASWSVENLASLKSPSPDCRAQVLRRVDEDLGMAEVIQEIMRDPQDSIVVTDASGRINWVNEAFTRLCGFSAEELKGQRPGAVLQGELTDPAAVAQIRAAIRHGQTCFTELVNYHKDGHPYWVAISINPLRDYDGEVRGFFAIEQEIHGRELAAARPTH